MAKPFLTPLVFKPQPVPNSPQTGTLYYDDTENKMYYRSNTTWVEVGLTNAVTTDTTQTITGTKTINKLNVGKFINLTDSGGPLKKFREALARVDIEPVDILSIGASVDEGYYAGTDEERYIAIVRRELQNLYNPDNVQGGEGYIPARHVNGSGLAQRWTYGGGFAVQSNWTYGLGKRYAMLDAAAEYAQITVTGDRFWITYVKGNSVGAFTVTVDGGAPVTVDAYDSGPVVTTGVYDTGVLTRGPHTIKVQPSAGGTNPVSTTRLMGLDGIMVFDGDGGAAAGTGKGVRWWDGAHSGYKASDFNITGTWITTVPVVSPDLVTIHFGGNEYLLGIASETFRSSLTGLINKVRAATTTNPSILLLLPHEITDTTGYTPIEPMANYRKVVEETALTMGCAVLDWSEKIPAAGGTGGGGLWYENIHPNNYGMRALASELLDFLVGSRDTQSPRNMVTTDTNQAIVGLKTFTSLTADNLTSTSITTDSISSALGSFLIDNTGVGATAVYTAELSVSGITGAIQGSRYVGATTSGAPTTGSFTVGDWIIARNGAIWICTTAGTPGSWTQVGSTLTSITVSGAAAAQRFQATGMTGATSSSRYVGATTTAAPTTGTFAVGDFVIGQNGKIWICTTAGTPGTWTEVGAGSAPANMVTTDTTQTITGAKTFSALTTIDAFSTNTAMLVMNSDTGDVAQFWNSGNEIFAIGATRPRLNGQPLYTNIEPLAFSRAGVLTVGAGSHRIYVEGNYTIETVRASVGTASAGSDIIIDVNVNGTTIYSTQGNRPTITAGTNTATGSTRSTNTVTTGQYITIDIDQIGSTTAGSDLTVVIRLRRT